MTEDGAPGGGAILTLPNLISVVRLALIPLLWWWMATDHVAAAGWLLGVIGSTDWIDGYLARRLNQVSEVGKFLDPLADRLAVAAAVVGGLVFDIIAAFGSAKIPDRINVFMLNQDFDQMIAIASNDIDHTTGKVGGIQYLIEVGGTERVFLAGDHYHCIAASDSWGH